MSMHHAHLIKLITQSLGGPEQEWREGSLNSMWLILPNKYFLINWALFINHSWTKRLAQPLPWGPIYLLTLRRKLKFWQPSVQQRYNRVVHITFSASYTVNLLTCVCNLVKPRIQSIWPALGFLSESTSNFSSPMLMASVYSSGWPLPQLQKSAKYIKEFYVHFTTYESIFGIFLVGTVVTSWPHNNVPTPKNKHHNHCSNVKLFVENAILPYWIIKICNAKTVN